MSNRTLSILLLLAVATTGCQDAAGRRDANDAAPEKAEAGEFENPVIAGLWEVFAEVDEQGVFDELPAEQRRGLLDDLRTADRTITSIKRENAEAIRQVNRQQRLAHRQPHIVLIVADDLAFGDLGPYGQERIATPHLDALAESGARFSNFYAGGPTDASSWWTLMTGRHTGADDGVESDTIPLLVDHRTFGEIMWDAGYRTGFFGVWRAAGEGGPAVHGFEESVAVLADAPGNASYPEVAVVNGALLPLPGNADDGHEVYGPALFTQQAEAFLDRYQPGRPMFLVVSPGALAPLDEGDPLETEATWTVAQRTHAAAVRRLDTIVGEVREALVAVGIADNTLLMITSDNGPADRDLVQFFESTANLSPDPLREGHLRVPLVVSWPNGLDVHGEVTSPAALWDILPTVVDVTRTFPPPQHLSGVSFAPVLTGDGTPPEQLLYWESHAGGFGQAVRRGHWKGFRAAGSTTLELYDLDADPAEAHDVAAEHPDIAKSLTRD